MTEFTPISASIGGALIGLSAVVLMAANGRIAGLSGILASGFLNRKPGGGHRLGDWWQLFFVAGVLLGPILIWLLGGSRPAFDMTIGLPLVVVGGFLVGFGSRLGSGCTSGHGICGLSRLSPRSLVSVLIFMVVAIVTASLVDLLGGVA